MNEFIEQDIKELILADVTVADLLRAGAPDESPRWFWGAVEQDPLSPYAILGRVSDDSDSTNSGASGLEQSQYTITCWSRVGMEEATRLANAIKARLKELCGEGRITNAGRTIQGIFYGGQVDVLESPNDGGQIGTVGCVVRLSIAYEDNETA